MSKSRYQFSDVHPVLLEKWTQAFHFADMNNDGLHTFRDYEIRKERLMKNAKLTPAQREDVLKMYSDVWFTHLEAKRDESLAVDQWLMKIKKSFDREDLKTLMTGMKTRTFHCVDMNGDGLIDISEFLLFADAAGRSDAPYRDRAFRAIDVNGDGLITLDEYVGAHVKYFTDPAVKMIDLPIYGLPAGFSD